MDFLQFTIKRAHLKMVAFGRKLFEPNLEEKREGVEDMTPARFDLLFAIRGARSRRLSLEQRDLRTKLGLSKPTVSKMLTRLEQLGLVRRERCTHDRRQKTVFLTEEGLRRIKAAFHIVFGKGRVRRKVQRMFVGPRRRLARLAKVRRRIYEIYTTVRRVARHFGDATPLLYATSCPDEDD